MRFIPAKICLDNVIVIPKRLLGDYSALIRLVKKIHNAYPCEIVYAFIQRQLPASSILLLTTIKDYTLLNAFVAHYYKTRAKPEELFDAYYIYTPNKRLKSCLYPDVLLPEIRVKLPLFDRLKEIVH